MKPLLVLLVLAVLLTPLSASAWGGGWGTVQTVSPAPTGGSWVQVHVDGIYPNGYFTTFRSTRTWTAGRRAYVIGQPDATRYVADPLVISLR